MPREQEVELVDRLKRGDRAAAGLLYSWYGERLYRQVILHRLPVRELAEDVLKDTFRMALERIAQFDWQDKSIYAWLRRIAINRATDVYRARQRARHMEEQLIHNDAPATIMADPPPPPELKPEQEETRAHIERALAQLNPRFAAALRMRLLEDRERDECAAHLGVSVGNFDVILHRACKAFREIYVPPLESPEAAPQPSPERVE